LLPGDQADVLFALAQRVLAERVTEVSEDIFYKPTMQETVLAVFKGAEVCLPAFAGIHARLVSAGQERADVPPYPWRSFHGPARVFYKCSTSGSRPAAAATGLKDVLA
jgi:hypothetical protein